MQLKVKRLILWPKNTDHEIRIIPFSTEYVNVISGDNARGKSAIISIIDYCLASSKCNIPIRLIRDLTSWFGVVFEFDKEEMLLARKEPGQSQISHEMFMIKGENIAIPQNIESNVYDRDVINELNKYAGLTKVDFTFNDNDKGFKQSASIRDLISLNFQPQYIVANPYALFYKADTHKNREKLITILPYILGIIDDEILELKEELKELKRQESSLSRELDQRKSLVNNWLSEIKGYYAMSYELGLLKTFEEKETWNYNDYINELRKALNSLDKNKFPLIEAGASIRIAQRVAELNEVEYSIALEIQEKKERLSLISQIKSSNTDYGDALLIQNKRLSTVGWFKKHVSNLNKCPFCNGETNTAEDYVNNVYILSEELIGLSQKVTDSHKVFTKEITNLNSKLILLENQINDIRTEKYILTQENQEHRNQRQILDRIFMFGGQLEEALSNYDKITDSRDIENRLSKLLERILKIEETINEERLARLQKQAIIKIGKNIKFYANLFSAEYAQDEITFDIANLTLSFSSGKRTDFLWEIGSGHNFMAYHIAAIFSIHEYLLTLNKKNKVPQFIIFDQPSQVYFVESDSAVKKEKAVSYVEKIFEVFAKFKERTNSNIQVIVLEHAGKAFWKNHNDDIKLIKNWRDGSEDDALILKEWFKKDLLG